jgi:protein O-mannosyl-transferase
MSAARKKRQTTRHGAQPHAGRPVSKSAPPWIPPAGAPDSLTKALLAGRALWVSLFLIASSALVYAALGSHKFLAWGDTEYISDNPAVSHGLTWQGISRAFTTVYFFNWHPLTSLSYMLDVQLYGSNPGPYHVTNLAFHIANALLIFGVFHRLTGAMGRSAFVAALFALHPLHVESVAWLSERKDVLSTLFWMLTLAAYARYAEKPQTGRSVAVFVLFALGLMAKPMLVTLPFVLLLMDYWPLGRLVFGTGASWQTLWHLAREKVPLLGLALASSILTVIVQANGGAVAGLGEIPLSYRLENVVVSYAAYGIKMIWPTSLAAFYPYPRSLSIWWVAGAVLFLIGVSAAALKAAPRHPYLPVGWLWYLGTLIPVIGVVQVGRQAIADRYTYVPLIGLFIVATWGLTALAERPSTSRSLLPAGATLAVAACMVLTWRQVRYWKDDISLWNHDLQVTSENYAAEYNLGIALSEQGQLDSAIAHYLEAVRINPNLGGAQLHVAADLAKVGRTDEAIAHYREAIRVNPNFPEAYNNLGALLADRGKIDEAISEYREAIRVEPDYADPHFNLGAALKDQGKLAEAAQEFKEALRINPNLAEARQMLEELGRPSP